MYIYIIYIEYIYIIYRVLLSGKNVPNSFLGLISINFNGSRDPLIHVRGPAQLRDRGPICDILPLRDHAHECTWRFINYRKSELHLR